MAVATVLLYQDTGAVVGTVGTNAHGTTATSVDAGTIKFGLTDAVDASASPIAVPASPGNNYSYAKALYLNITVAATTSTNLLNRKVSYNSVPTGLNYFWKNVARNSYALNSAAADVSNASANGTAPTGYTAMTTTPTAYDSASQASTATGQNGAYAYVAAGVAGNYASGGGLSAVSTITFTYDEQFEVDAFAFDQNSEEYGENRLNAKRSAHLPMSMRRGALI